MHRERRIPPRYTPSASQTQILVNGYPTPNPSQTTTLASFSDDEGVAVIELVATKPKYLFDSPNEGGGSSRCFMANGPKLTHPPSSLILIAM